MDLLAILQTQIREREERETVTDTVTDRDITIRAYINLRNRLHLFSLYCKL